MTIREICAIDALNHRNEYKDLSCTAGVPHNVLDVPAVVNDRPEDKILIDVVYLGREDANIF